MLSHLKGYIPYFLELAEEWIMECVVTVKLPKTFCKKNSFFVCSILTIECLKSESKAENQEMNERLGIKICKHSKCDNEAMNRIITVKLK